MIDKPEPAYVETMRRADETQMAYERGYRSGIMAALDDPEESRSYLTVTDDYLDWLQAPVVTRDNTHDPF